jgi:hypothetical protein
VRVPPKTNSMTKDSGSKQAQESKHKRASGREEQKEEMERNSEGKKGLTETKTIKTGIGKRGIMGTDQGKESGSL